MSKFRHKVTQHFETLVRSSKREGAVQMQALSVIPNSDIWSNGGVCTPILVVDDEEFNVKSVLRAATKEGVINPIVAAHDGLTALSLLREWLGDRSVLPPIVILLDLNMPRMNGLEFLDEVRSDPALRYAHIFIFSSSTALSDISSAYERNIAGYIMKNDAHSEIMDVVKLLDTYINAIRFSG